MPLSSNRIIFVGPSPTGSPTRHPGGQLTAALGIAGYASSHGFSIDPIDTSVDGFSRLGISTRLRLGIARAFTLRRKLRGRDVRCVMFFVGARLSLLERALLALLARWYGVPTVFCIRDGTFVGWIQSSVFLQLLVALLLRIPSRVVVQGGRIAEGLVAAGVPEKKIVVVHNWLPPSFEIADEPRAAGVQRPLRLVFVGWLVKDKGIWELIDAFAELSKRHELTLDIIGGGTLDAQLRDQIAQRGLGGCRVHAWMSRDDVRRCLDDCDVFVLPSYYEGFPNVVLEAMARGLPVICSDVGAVSDTIEDGVNGFLVPPKDAQALVVAVEKYVRDPRLLSIQSKAAMERVRLLHDRDANLRKLFHCFEQE